MNVKEEKMDKLTVETKKQLAEKVMGWEFKVNYTCLKLDCFVNKEGGYIVITEYNPDQDTPEGLSQFVELIGKLRPGQEINLSYKLKLGSNGLDCFKWLCSHKYEVCMAIKEVIG